MGKISENGEIRRVARKFIARRKQSASNASSNTDRARTGGCTECLVALQRLRFGRFSTGRAADALVLLILGEIQD